MFTIRKSLFENDQGKCFIRYAPALVSNGKFGPCFTGEVTFACWDVEVGMEQAHHDEAMKGCLANARKVLAMIASE